MRKLNALLLTAVLGTGAALAAAPAQADVIVGVAPPAVVAYPPVAVYPRPWVYGYPGYYPGVSFGWRYGGWYGYHGDYDRWRGYGYRGGYGRGWDHDRGGWGHGGFHGEGGRGHR
jgi:hypothetical protein